MVRINKRTAQRGEQYVEDRRGQSGRRNSVPRSGGGVSVGKAGGGLGAIIAIILALIFGGDISGGGSESSTGTGADINAPGGFDSGQQVPADGGATNLDPDADTVDLMKFVMADTQDVWSAYFDQVGL
jgi:predicted metalloprotease